MWQWIMKISKNTALQAVYLTRIKWDREIAWLPFVSLFVSLIVYASKLFQLAHENWDCTQSI